jgi:hypothetical protein
MEILRQGKLPEEKEYVGDCRRCNTQVRFKHSEGETHYSQHDGDSISVVCPLCKTLIYVDM